MLTELLPIFLLHLALTALPGVAATLLVARRGVRSVPVLLSVGLVGTGTVAMATFWLYLAEPLLGKGFTVLTFIGSVLVVGTCLRHGDRLDATLLRQLGVPLALWGLGSAFVLFLGFGHGGISTPIATSLARFSHPLPTDSAVPFFYSNWFYGHGHSGSPPIFPGGWLSSDRPPLQVGYALAQRPGNWGNVELHYQTLGVLLQQLWIIGAWALLIAGRVGRTTRVLVMLTLLTSGLVLVNGFFVWPKLLPAAMLLAAAALVATPQWREVRGGAWGAFLVGSLLALALLGHGGSAFMAIPLACLMLVRGFRDWRWLAVAGIVGLAFLIPWSAYQEYGDPPGDRVTKWMLAGDLSESDDTLTDSIIDGYGEIGLQGALDYKLENFETMTGRLFSNHQAIEELRWGFDGGVEAFVRSIRVVSFFFLLPSLGLLLIAPMAMAYSRIRRKARPEEWRFAAICLALTLAGCLAWGLLLFGSPDAVAINHIGSYAVPALALCGLVIGLRASFPRVAVGFVSVNALISLAVYAPAFDPAPGSSYSIVLCACAFVSLVLFVLASWRSEQGRTAGEEPRGRRRSELDGVRTGNGDRPESVPTVAQ